jgi:hypothetical protein
MYFMSRSAYEPTSLSVEPATVADAEGIANIYVNHAADSYISVIGDDPVLADGFRTYFAKTAANIEQSLADPATPYWVVRSGLEVVGMGGFDHSSDRIHSMYTSRQSAGIGSLCLRRILDETSDVPDRRLLVADFNRRAVAFYGRQNFIETGNFVSLPLTGSVSIRTVEMAYKD